MTAFPARGGTGRGGWLGAGQVATGTTAPARVRFADFDGDGVADYAAIAASGEVTRYLIRGGDGWLQHGWIATGLDHGGWAGLGKVAGGAPIAAVNLANGVEIRPPVRQGGGD